MNQEAGRQRPQMVPEGFKEFFTAYEPRVRKFLRWCGFERCHEDDIVQMTMEEALAYFEKVRDLDKPEYWLFKVARQRRARLAQEQSKHGNPTQPEALPHLAFHEGRYAAVEEQDSPVFAALAQLPAEQREAVLLHAFRVTHREIAEFQNIAVSSARSRVSRAHDVLRTSLDEEDLGMGEVGHEQ